MIDFKIDYKDILENITDGVYITDIDRKVLYWNKAAEEITGYKSQEVIGKHCYDNILVHIDGEGCCLCKGLCPLAKSIQDGTSRNRQVYLHHKNGHRKAVQIRIVPIKDKTCKTVGAVEFFNEIPEEKAFALKIEELESLSFKDQLTNLPNRRFAEEKLKSKISELNSLGISFGLLFFDIDHFKTFNDSYGHETGDKILRVISETLKSNSRPYDIYARWGGEEFIGIITRVTEDSLKKIANKIRVLVKSSYIEVKGNKLNVTISIGGLIPSKDNTIQSIINRADALMYESKKKGRDCVTI